MLETATTHTCYWWIKIPDWDKGTEQSVCTWKGLIFCNCNLKYFRIVHHPNYKFLFKVIIVLCRASGNLCRHCGTNASYMASTNVQFKPPDRYGGWCLKAIFLPIKLIIQPSQMWKVRLEVTRNASVHGRGSRFSRPWTESPRFSVQVSSRNRSRNQY